MGRIAHWLVPLLLLSACATLPDSGPVHRVQSKVESSQAQLPNFAPPGPEPGGDPTSIARGFLRALTAAPFTTSVARKFLTEDAASTWKLDGGTIVYSAVQVQPTASGVAVNLTVSEWLDGFGTWLPVADTSQQLPLELVQQDGQWRIANPINKLLVPQPYFIDAFQRLGVYFFDQTDKALVSTPVFLLRGEQLASELVRSLFSGPAPGLSDILHSAFPVANSDPDLSVVVSGRGVASVPVTKAFLNLPPAQVARATAQVAWTLRQVDGVSSVLLTVDGTPVPISGGENSIPVSDVEEFNALTGKSEIWAMREGRLVQVHGRSVIATTGPLGRKASRWSSLAVNDRNHQVAVVSADGRNLLLAGSLDNNQPIRRVLRGSELLPPSYDALGDLWVIDRNHGKAAVWVIANGHPQSVSIPGVTNRAVSAAEVSGEGSRLAVLVESETQVLEVINLLRDQSGTFVGPGKQRPIQLPVSGSSEGPFRDLGWRDSDTIALLSSDSGATRISYLSSDGSPADPSLIATSPLFTPVDSLVISPDAALPIALSTNRGDLFTMTSTGGWKLWSSGIAIPSYSR